MIGDGLVRFSEEGGGATRPPLLDKYALALALTDPGFDSSVLCEFRARLLAHGREQLLLDTLLAVCQQHGWLKVRGQQRTDSTHVLAAIRVLGRLELAGETLRAALNAVATAAPDWLRALSPPEWFDRYNHRIEDYRLPKPRAARQAYAATIGVDGQQLLTAVYAGDAPVGLRTLPAVEILRRVWVQEFVIIESVLRWRTPTELAPASQRIESPYDIEARYATKGQQSWVGYKVHLTETCDPDRVHVITQVTTTEGTVYDADVAAPIQAALIATGLAPGEHFLDGGYVDTGLVVQSAAQHAITTIGPARPNVSWQARAGQGYDLGQFTVDWVGQRVQCPQGQWSRVWSPHTDAWDNPAISVRFRRTDCAACEARALCTQAKAAPRHLTLRPQADHTLLQEMRQKQGTRDWQQYYQRRAGIEGTLSQGIRAFGLRHCRYIGLARTHLQHLLVAVALNVVRLVAWWTEATCATTRRSQFAALQPATT